MNTIKGTSRNKQPLIISKYVEYFLKTKPFFYVFIRPMENYYFHKYKKYLGKDTLDFGCGDGFFKQIVFPNKRMVGLDVFGSDVHLAKTSMYKNITLYDGLKIPFKNNQFESVISNSVLEHIPNLKKTVKEISRIIKPKGYFLCSVMTEDWNRWLLGKKILGDFYTNYMIKKQNHPSLLSEVQLENIFIKYGFEVVAKEKYLTHKVSNLLEISHFLAIPSFLFHKIFGKWTLGLFANKSLINFLSRFLFSESEKAQKSSSLFFVLQKV